MLPTFLPVFYFQTVLFLGIPQMLPEQAAIKCGGGG